MSILTEEFDDPMGRFIDYEAYNLDVNEDLRTRSHATLRTFTSEISSKPKTLYDFNVLISALNPLSMTDFEGYGNTPMETWSVGNYGPDTTLNNHNTLRLAVSPGLNTTVSDGNLVDISIFKATDEISVALPNFPASSLDLSRSYLNVATPTHSARLSFGNQNLTNGNMEAKWSLSEVFSTLTQIKTVSFEFQATASATVTIAGLRVIPTTWTPTALDINTQFQRLEPTLTRTGGIPPIAFPQVWRTGVDNPMPVDTKLGVTFFTGTATNAANSFTAFFRARREDFLLQSDIDVITDQADLDTYGVQPDYGRAVYNPRPQTDYDALQQSTLDTFSQFEMERQPDIISEAWLQITLGWGQAAGANKISVSTTETLSSPVNFTPTFANNKLYHAVFEVVDESVRVRVYDLDAFGKVNTLIYDTQEIKDDFLVHRRKGKFGWVASLADGSSWIGAIRTRGLMFNEVSTQNYESFTPVDGARLFVSATPDMRTPLGLEPFNGGTLEVDFDRSRSSDGAAHVISSVPLVGVQSEFFDFEDFENVEINFDFYYEFTEVLPEVYLFNDQGLLIALRMPGLVADQWNTVRVRPSAAFLEQTGKYRVVIAPVSVSTAFWIDNLSITQRSIRWTGRSSMQDPWGRLRNVWTEFGSLINKENGGVMFPTRDRYLQLRGQTLSQKATIDKFYIKPKYAELGRIPPTGPTINTPVLPKSSHYINLTVTPAGGAIGTTVDGNTYSWPGNTHYAINTVLTFTATVVNNPTTGAIVEYYWDFGDGIEATTTTNTITHTYRYPSPSTIAHVRTRDANGEQGWASQNLMLQ